MNKHILYLIILVFFNNLSFAQCWTKISSGDSHALAIKNDGTLWAWGSNIRGELGDGTFVGKNSPVQIGFENNWVDVQAGYEHNIALKNNGTIWTWGWNCSGQLGNGTYEDNPTPYQVGTDNNWNRIFAKMGHQTMALKNDGTLWVWGINVSGQLGDGTVTDRLIPTQIGTATDWDKIVPGSYHTMAIKTNGTLWGWGNNEYGQIGDGTNIDKLIPIQIGTDSDWVEVTVGYWHTVALKNNGTLWAWGSNYDGQLGNGLSGPSTSTNSPNQIGAANDWIKIDSGLEHTIATKVDGTLWGWGWNYTGQLGIGNLIEQHEPIQIGSLNNWNKISVGNLKSHAIDNNNALWSWGSNDNGELGDGTNISSTIPINISCINLDVNDFIYIDNIKIYPNPTQNNITFNQEVKTVSIYTQDGKLLNTQLVNSQIDLSGFNPGIYLVRGTTIDGVSFSEKLVKN